MNPVKSILGTGAGIVGGAASQGVDLLRKAQNLRPSPKPEMTDETLKSKVESVLFRAPGVSRGDINVTVVDRRVTLHGKAKNPAAVRSMEAAVTAIPEVTGVDNRLAIEGSSSRKKPAARKKPRTTGQRVNREVKATSRKEPAPKELAAERKGRQPAPLGSKETPGSGAGVETPGAKVEAALAATDTTRGSTKSGAASGTETTTGAAKASTKSASGSTSS